MDAKGLMVLMLVGIVIQHGNAFVDTYNHHLVTIFPSNSLLTKSLSSKGGNVVGFSSKGFFILKFKINESGNYVLYYYISRVSFDNPMKVLIYTKRSNNWELIKSDVADVGWHKAPLPNLKEGIILIKFKFTKTLKQGAGASFVDYVYLKKVNHIISVVDWRTMQVFAFGRWFSFAIFTVIVFSSIFGSCTFNVSRPNFAIALAVAVISLLALIINANIFVFYYLYPSAFSIIFSVLIYSTSCVLMYNFINKLSKNTKN